MQAFRRRPLSQAPARKGAKMNPVTALFSNPFLQMALFSGVLASIAGGIVGSYVVIKRIVFISGSIAHSVLGGMGLALFLQYKFNLPWLSPIYGAFVFAILSALLIGWIHLRFKEREDTVIAALWASGMALGVLLISLTPGSNPDLLNFLFGNILWTSHADVLLLIAADAIIVISVLAFHRKLLLVCFDEDQAKLQKIPTQRLYLYLLCLVALTTVLLIQVVGAVLVIAMLSLPAAIANRLTYNLPRLMITACILGIAFTAIGLVASYAYNWPPGATIALTATLAYLASLSIKNSK